MAGHAVPAGYGQAFNLTGASVQCTDKSQDCIQLCPGSWGGVPISRILPVILGAKFECHRPIETVTPARVSSGGTALEPPPFYGHLISPFFDILSESTIAH